MKFLKSLYFKCIFFYREDMLENAQCWINPYSIVVFQGVLRYKHRLCNITLCYELCFMHLIKPEICVFVSWTPILSGEILLYPINVPVFRLCKCVQCKITGLHSFLNQCTLKILIFWEWKKIHLLWSILRHFYTNITSLNINKQTYITRIHGISK